MKWRYTRRTIGGKRVKVKVHKKADGGTLVRKCGYKNRKD